MPFVIVFHDPDVINNELLCKILDELPTIIADELSAPLDGGNLLSDHIEIQVQEPGHFDRNRPSFSVSIAAHTYPSRESNVDLRRERIARRLRDIFPELANLSGTQQAFIEINLSRGSFGYL